MKQQQVIHQLLTKHSHDQNGESPARFYTFLRIISKEPLAKVNEKRHKKKKENLSLSHIYSLAIKVELLRWLKRASKQKKLRTQMKQKSDKHDFDFSWASRSFAAKFGKTQTGKFHTKQLKAVRSAIICFSFCCLDVSHKISQRSLFLAIAVQFLIYVSIHKLLCLRLSVSFFVVSKANKSFMSHCCAALIDWLVV